MRRVTFLIAVLTMLVFASCSKQPAANFTADKTTVLVGENVKFTNTSSDADKYVWDFGTGNGVTETSPTHSWSEGGTYKVTLTAKSKNGNKSNTFSSDIKVSKADEKFLGTWNMNESETADYCPNYSQQYQITIVEPDYDKTGNTVLIQNFGDGISFLEGKVSGNIINLTLVHNVYAYSGLQFDISSGTFIFSGTSMNYSVHMTDFAYSGSDCGNMYFTGTASKSGK